MPHQQIFQDCLPLLDITACEVLTKFTNNLTSYQTNGLCHGWFDTKKSTV